MSQSSNDLAAPQVRGEVVSTTSLSIRPFVFRKADWSYVKNGEGRPGIESAIPGTWDTGPIHSPSWLLAIVCCPACRGLSMLRKEIHAIDSLGKISPDLYCPYNKNGQRCGFHRKAYLDEWNKKTLYACAVERNGKPEIHYMHAKDQKEARIHLGPGNYHIVAIGRAIGFFVHDAHGEDLSADGRRPLSG